ncbi:DUF6272 family protein [Pararhodospirillum oryzae]|nr:DUF6272 family protein [Pararhodospirillum oryzae]
MSERIGDVEEPAQGTVLESLVLSFSPSLVPLRQRWRNNGLSADFLGDYVTTFFPASDDDPTSGERAREARTAVSYIANELLENAMKYSVTTSAYPITIHLILEAQTITISASNPVTHAEAERVETLARHLDTTDPQEAYLAALEQSVLDEDTSGLGLVTILNDYGARIGWRFTPLDDELSQITLLVRLSV